MKRTKLALSVVVAVVAVIGTMRQWFPFVVGTFIAALGGLLVLGIQVEFGKSDADLERLQEGETPVTPYSPRPLDLREPSRHDRTE